MPDGEDQARGVRTAPRVSEDRQVEHARRAARLAKAMRENLQKRKRQQRARAEPAAEPEP